MPVPSAAVEAVWRIESGRLVAALTRITGDFAAAEDLAQDALERALRQWPAEGIPEHPPAWLMATAKHLAVDAYRRRLTLTRKLAELARETTDAEERDPMAAVDQQLDTVVPDDLLRLAFLTCHPALTTESQVALTLRTIGGLTTREIARAFLVPEPTVGQRISRAKKTLADRRARFELPLPTELPARLGAVLAVVYLIFNEGYAATSGHDWTRPELCQDALRLGRLLAGLRPDEPEVHGLVALMELQASRIPARTGPSGEPVLLRDQDRRRWDPLLLRRGLAALETAESLGTGPYTLQAAIAACHARATSVESTDWRRIAALYTVLHHLAPSPVVALNRAVAVGMADGPDSGLALTQQLTDEPGLAAYPELAAVRATFLQQLGRLDEARAQFRLLRKAQQTPTSVTSTSAKPKPWHSRQPPAGAHRDPRPPLPTVVELGGKTANRLPARAAAWLTDCDDQPATPLDHGRHRTVSSTSPRRSAADPSRPTSASRAACDRRGEGCATCLLGAP